ncbi:FAD binding domain-containing protein [Mycena polygramma]|nr:FAD binding domain-containing protein [Mycena polygramma]
MNTNSNPKILIAGAGPSGLILALALRRSGVRVRIIEKAPVPAVGQRGPGIQPRTQELFRALGVLDDINKQAIALLPMRSYVPPEGTVPLKTFFMAPPVEPTPARPFEEIITIGQNHLEAILRDVLRTKYSCEVEFGTSLLSLKQDADGVDATIGKPDGQEETQRFEFLVGADGARGVVRKQCGLTFLGESRPSIKFIIGDLRVEGIDEDYWHSWGDPKSDSVLLRPTGVPGLFGLALILAGPKIDDEALLNDRTALQDTISSVTGRKDIKVVDVPWITKWSPNIRMTDRYSAGRCFLTGDAAHVHSPTGGQGLNSGAQDSFNLAWKLALVIKGRAPITLLDSYNDERLPVVKEMLGTTTKLLDKTVGENSVAGDTEKWDRSGPLLMLGVNYRWSAIVVDEQDENEAPKVPNDAYGARTRGLKAGDRAPDAPELHDTLSTQSGGVLVRLFDVFDFSRHTVLVFSAAPERYDALLTALARYPEGSVHCVAIVGRSLEADIRGPDVVLEDTQGHAYGSYHFEGGCDIAVVRPDGILGAVVRSVEGVEGYFSRIFE